MFLVKHSPKIFLSMLAILPILALSACNNGSDEKPQESTQESTQVTTAPNIQLDLIKEGASDYTIVYDDSDDAVTALVDEMVAAFAEKKVTVNSVASSKAEADYGHEIIVGNVRSGVSSVVDKLNKTGDFGMCVSGDDWVLYGTDSVQYKYMTEILKDDFFKQIKDGTFAVESVNDFIFHESKYSAESYVQYMKDKTNDITLNFLYENLEKLTFKASDNTELPYRLYVPSNYDSAKKYPVLIFLHGAGERGTDNQNHLKNAVPNLFNLKDSPVFDAIVIIPQCPNDNQWVDTPWSKGSYRLSRVEQSNELGAVMELFEQIKKDYSTDSNRYYAMGISMGGFGTWDLLMRYPDVFAAGIPICGGADPAMASKLKNMPIYTAHGSADSIVPVAGTREMVEALEKAGSTVITYNELEGYDHDVWSNVSSQPSVMEWLFSQTRENRA